MKSSVCGTLDHFIKQNRLSYEKQWGFVLGKSTESMLTYLTETWKRELDNKNVIRIVYIDVKKAFDCVSHTVLGLKLQAMSLSGPALNWLRNYLEGRKQLALVHGSTSELNTVNCRIPLGSLLGPRLFSYYANNLPNAISEGELTLCPDDTTLFYVGLSVDKVCNALNRILLQGWKLKFLSTRPLGE